MELPKQIKSKYKKAAIEHSEFLCEKVFKPAFQMAFLHGAKHMHEELFQLSKSPQTKKRRLRRK